MRLRKEHRHDVFHIVLVTEGEGTYSHRGSEIAVAGGSLVVIRPMEPHAFERLPGETTRYHEVTWSGSPGDAAIHEESFWDLLTEAAAPLRPDDVLPRRLEPLLRTRADGALVEIARTFRTGGRIGRFRATARLLDLWSEILDLVGNDARPRTDPFLVAKTYIERRYPETIDLARLASIVGLSYNYLSRGFKERFGQTPMRYLRRTRLVAAASLLRGSRYSHAEIAERVGIRGEAHFSRLFREHFGTSPRAWRAASSDPEPSS